MALSRICLNPCYPCSIWEKKDRKQMGKMSLNIFENLWKTISLLRLEIFFHAKSAKNPQRTQRDKWDRTQMTQMIRIFTDEISVNPLNPFYPRAILEEKNRTKLKRMKQIITGIIRVDPFNPRYPRAILKKNNKPLMTRMNKIITDKNHMKWQCKCLTPTGMIILTIPCDLNQKNMNT